MKKYLAGDPSFLHEFLQTGVDLQGTARYAACSGTDQDPLPFRVQLLTVKFLHFL